MTQRLEMEAKTPGRIKKYDGPTIAMQLTAWVKKDDSINFVGFCADFSYPPYVITNLEKSCDEFAEAYILAKMRLAERRERLMNEDKLNYGSFARYQAMYDPFLGKHEEDEKERDSKRKLGIMIAEQANLSKLAKMAADGLIKQPD